MIVLELRKRRKGEPLRLAASWHDFESWFVRHTRTQRYPVLMVSSNEFHTNDSLEVNLFRFMLLTCD